ncbi:MAG: DUF4126 domain-containing protein [Synechococcales cyanobacterium C42_A2020_086]|jgi:hypothetical protein|nr:DUF4126 domain-containing protein [Synechococcales cyanobacterium M58_A2018_015]MBF2075335.1 DUF4126 domain-containing protein [Synechococcales cyanobacterium C42_A2020_086]
MEPLLNLMLGMGLSAACGFRVFVPFLVMSLAAQSGYLSLAPGFEWVGSQAALTMFAVATLLEVAGYYIPWLDELLDVVATPTAIVAGTLTTAAVTTEMNPMLQWTLAALVGGGAAGITQGLTDITRLASTVTTGGLGNPLLSTMELVTSATLSVLAILLPVLAALLVMGVLLFAMGQLRKRRRRKQTED